MNYIKELFYHTENVGLLFGLNGVSTIINKNRYNYNTVVNGSDFKRKVRHN